MRSCDRVSVREVNLSQLAFLKFQRFLFRLLIFTLVLVPMMIGQWPDLGNLSRTIRSQLCAETLGTKDKSGLDHFL